MSTITMRPRFTRFEIVGNYGGKRSRLLIITAKSKRDALREFRSAGGYRAAMKDGFAPKTISAREL